MRRVEVRVVKVVRVDVTVGSLLPDPAKCQ